MRGFTLPRAGLLICAGLAMLSASCGSGTNDDLARLDSSPDPAVIAADAGRGAPVIAEMEQGALTRDGINADGLPPLPQPTRSANRTVLAVPGKNAMQKSAGTSISGERLVVQAPQKGIAWAMYGFSTAGGDEYAIELKSSVGDNPDQHYLAIADYGQDRWRWVGPYDGNGTYMIPQDGQYINDGHVYVIGLTCSGDRVVFDELELQLSTNPPPPPPTGLVATVQDGAVHLDWDAVATPGLLGYNIYYAERNFSQAGESTVVRYNLALIPPNGDPHVELNEIDTGTRYYFGVTSLAADQVESTMSNVATLQANFELYIDRVMFERTFPGYWVYVEGAGFDTQAGSTSVILNGSQTIGGANVQVTSPVQMRFRVPFDAPQDTQSNIRVKVFSKLSDSQPLYVVNPATPLKNWSQIGQTTYQEWQAYDPTGIAVDGGGRYWVGNENARRVDGFNPDGTPYDYVYISNARDIEVAANGDVWIKHGDGPEIWAYDPAGKTLEPAVDFTVLDDHFGSGDHFAIGPGNSWVVSDEENGRLARFIGNAFDRYIGSGTLSDPEDVEIDAAGRIVVADVANDHIYWFDDDGNLLGSYDGDIDTPDNTGEFNDPFGLAITPDGTVYCADINRDRILSFDPDSFEFTGEWGHSGYMDGSGKSLSDPTGQEGRFWSMWGIAADSSGRLAITDRTNQRMAVYDAGSGNVLFGLGDLVPDEGQWAMPRHVSIRHDTGQYIVLDEAAYSLTLMGLRNDVLDRAYLETSGNDADLITGRMGRTAYECCWGEDGKVYFSSDYTVLTEYTEDFSSYRVLATDWGSEDGRFKGNYSMAWWDGELFVTDQDNDRVQVFEDGFYKRQFAMPDPPNNSARRLAIDGYQGNLYVLSNAWSQSAEVLRFDLSTGAYLDKLVNDTGNNWGDALTVDAAGYIYIYGGTFLFTKYSTPDTPEGEYGKVASFGTWGDGDGQVRDISDIQMGPEGRFFISDDERRQLVVLAP
ncbi:MAG: hypothetical protein H7A35_08480 [Planctomycetales bacterium]|nr:hypothetical protein [bacterium]UNM06920.1 MAG: hypothetical protein H7A35_08480 [Planctomycetales bacterium]